jgi:branched-chain amino acid transport system ATP-binding protein
MIGLNNIRLRYGATYALDGISCTLPDAGLVVVFGPNGAGKTSLLDILSGALRPTSGDLEDGRGRHISRNALRRRCARMFQRTLVPNLRPAELLEFALHYHRPADLARRPTTTDLPDEEEQLLRDAGLDNRSAAPLAELSGGQQRLCMLVATLLRPCPILLVDEPLAGIGTAASERVIALLRREAEDRLVMVVDHESDRLFPLAKLLLAMRGGRLRFQGAPDALSDRALEDLYRA